MLKESRNIQMIQEVAIGFGNLLPEIVFVGGSVLEFYADDPTTSDIRPTLDVDCVIMTSTRSKYYDLEETLRKLGFKNDTTLGAPICRWLYQGIIVDIMPTDSSILGFSNRWYEAGIQNKRTLRLPNNSSIQIFPVEYYVATKLDAIKNRGGEDLRISHDFEDVVYVLDNCSAFIDVIKSSTDVFLKSFISEFFYQLLQNKNLEEAIQCCLPLNYGHESTLQIVKLIKGLSSTN
jgi:hypothetical protein